MKLKVADKGYIVFTKDEYLYRVQRAIIKNWIILSSLFLLIFVWMVYSIHTQNNKLSEMEKAIDTDLRSVIALTDSGEVVEIERQALMADNESAVVARALRLLVVSRSEVTRGFTVSEFQTPEEILKSTEQLQDFTEYLLIPDEKLNEIQEKIKQPDGKIETKTAKVLSDQGVGYFKAYLEALKQFVQSDTLPHFATIYKSEIKDYRPDQNHFYINIIFYTTLQQWKGKDANGNDIYETSNGQFEVQAQGFFNIKLRTKQESETVRGLNKLGLHFYNIKVTVPSKKS